LVEGIGVRPGGRYIDATVGAGGHAAKILADSAPDGMLLGIDADPDAVLFASQALKSFGSRATLIAANFRELHKIAQAQGFENVDGIVMDLGLSSRQLADPERGFSFSQDGPLDMRYDPGQGPSAADLINYLPEAELADLIWRYGEERQSRRIARAIVRARPLATTGQLASLIAQAAGRRTRIHPATRTFQALRIAVNEELEALVQALPQARDTLRSGGRLGVIAFHSLEDRIVKRFFRDAARDCICPPEVPACVCAHEPTLRVITGKPIRPTGEEIARNPRCRSAKLRIAQRLGTASVS
jgi:16S rRNA (cytosine1402-N4)-methyltransferase